MFKYDQVRIIENTPFIKKMPHVTILKVGHHHHYYKN